LWPTLRGPLFGQVRNVV